MADEKTTTTTAKPETATKPEAKKAATATGTFRVWPHGGLKMDDGKGGSKVYPPGHVFKNFPVEEAEQIEALEKYEFPTSVSE